MNKTLIGLALVALVALLVFPAPAQDIRDIAQQKDADITSSTSTGTDKHDLHSDTEMVGQAQQHGPALLGSRPNETKDKKMSQKEINRLEEKRKQLLKERSAAGETAAIRAETAARATGTPAARTELFTERAETAGQKTISSTAKRARKDAERNWDDAHGAELAKIERALKEKESSTRSKEVQLHGPALIDSR